MSSVYSDYPEKRHNSIGGSEQGSYDVALRAGSQRARMLISYFDYSQLTGSEAAKHAGISLTSGYRMRVTELRRAGLIEAMLDDDGNEILQIGLLGSPQTLCRITDDGKRAVRGLL